MSDENKVKTCKTCKFWKKAEDQMTIGLPSVGKCENIPMFWEATEGEGDGRKFLDQYKDVKAFAMDRSGYLAYLLTRPNFGCVLHEDKP